MTADEATNATEVDAFISKLSNPYFEEVLATGTYETGPQILEYAVANDDKTEHKFTYFEMKTDPKSPTPAAKNDKGPAPKKDEAEFAVLKVSEWPYFFKVRKARVDEFAKMQRSTFLKKKTEGEAPKPDLKEAGQLKVPGPG